MSNDTGLFKYATFDFVKCALFIFMILSILSGVVVYVYGIRSPHCKPSRKFRSHFVNHFYNSVDIVLQILYSIFKC